LFELGNQALTFEMFSPSVECGYEGMTYVSSLVLCFGEVIFLGHFEYPLHLK
jgi:hypothetical protein